MVYLHIFVIYENHSSPLQLFECEEYNSNTCLYYGLIVPRSKPCKTIHDNILSMIFRNVVLIFIVVSCILWTSSIVPCLSRRGNDSTREIIFKFDFWANKAFKKYENVIQIMMSLFFTPINPRSITRSFSRSVVRWIRNKKSNGISYSWYPESNFL